MNLDEALDIFKEENFCDYYFYKPPDNEEGRRMEDAISRIAESLKTKG